MKQQEFIRGLKTGIPIGLGYFAVAFSLGIYARNAGVAPLQGFLASLVTRASAGEYAAYSVIGADASYLEMAIIILIANCRYLLMSFALSQRVTSKLGMVQRLLMGAFITDEVFGVCVAEPKDVHPYYMYGLALVSGIPWACGTMVGIIAGNLLPDVLVKALGIALYTMFLTVIIPPCRKNPIIAGLVAISFGLSYLFSILPVVSEWSEGIRVIILTIVIAGLAALIFPVKEEEVKRRAA